MVPDNSFATKRDVYINYPYEQVLFHWQKPDLVWRRFYGAASEAVTNIRSKLFRDAQRHGEETTQAVYARGSGS